MSELVNFARILARKGFTPTPLKHDTKQPMDKGWPGLGVSKATLDDWESNPRYKDASLGIVTRNTPAIDSDIHDKATAEAMKSFIASLLGVDALLHRTGLAPKFLVPCQTGEPFPKMKSKKYEDFLGDTQQIEILGDGQQFAAFGVHEKTGKPYQWNGELPLRKRLPVLTPELASKVIAEFERLADLEGWDIVSKGSTGHSGASEGDSFWTPMPDINMEQVRKVMDVLPNDGDYDEWFADLCSLKYQTGDTAEGMEIMLDYSGKSNKHEDDDYAIERWNSISLNHPNARTFASLIAKAKEHGFDVNAEEEESGKELVSTMARFNNRYGLADVEGVTTVVSREVDLGTGDPKLKFMQPRHFKELRNNNYAVDKNGDEIMGGKKFDTPIPEGNYWMTHSKRNTYEQVYFKPIPGLVFNPQEPMPQGDVFNLFTGLKFLPVKGDWSLIRNHIFKVWCQEDGELFVYIMGWMAQMFQKPGEPGYSTIILQSEEGGGKNIIVDMLVDALGPHGVICSKPDDVLGRFNSVIATAVLLFMNEAVWGGDKKLEGPLKQLVTDEYLTMERKFIERVKIKNCTHLIFSSNNDFPAYIGRTDRRNVVLELSKEHTDSAEYFEPLRYEIANGGKEAFIHHLLNMDLSKFNPRKLPAGNTELKHKIKLEGGTPIEKWFAECLDLGEIRGSNNTTALEAAAWSEKEENVVSRKTMIESLEFFCQVKKLFGGEATSQKLGVFLADAGINLRKRRGIYIIPSVEESAKSFNKYMKSAGREFEVLEEEEFDTEGFDLNEQG